MRTLYLDNAATSWPKPSGVPAAVRRELVHGGGNPGRSGHRKSIEAGRVVLACRERLAALFGVSDPSHIVFTKNATEALNIVIAGIMGSGGHVVTTGMEHNSVLRPLRALETAGVVVEEAAADAGGRVDASDVARRITAGTRLVIVTHASNVTGAINDIAAIGAACRARGVPFLVDAAQTAGCVPIDVAHLPVDYLAFSGHKGLLGPQGTGGLYVGDVARLPPLLRGGTGSLSDREEQPDFLPDRYESGTLNVPGLAGLAEGVQYLLRRGVDSVQEHDRRLRAVFLDAASGDARVKVLQSGVLPEHTGVASVIIEGRSPSAVGEALERRFGILTRIGLHCAPRAHRAVGTFPEGTVRLSWGPFTSERDMARAGRAIAAIAGGR